ncbi:MAG: hypothetical protein AB2A00_27125 [Myxococcota bacterium]
MAELSDARSLLGELRRPGQAEIDSSDWSTYREAVDVRVKGATRDGVPPHELLSAILRGLYQYPDRAVWAVAATSSDVEMATLAVWSQQWPRLRRSFAFCTWSGRPRSLGGRPLDLQFTTRVGATRWRREKADLQELSLVDTLPPAEPWLAAALDDIESDSRDLRRFLWRYGAEADPPRAAFATLVEIFNARRHSERSRDYSALVRTVGEAFQSAGQMRLLKEDLLGAPADGSDDRLLEALVSVARPDAFDPGSLKVGERAENIVRQDPEAGMRLLSSCLVLPRSELRDAVLRAVTATLLRERPKELLGHGIDVFCHLVREDARVAASPAIWRRSAWEQRQVFALVAAADAALRKDIVQSMLDAGSDDLVDDVVRTWGDDVVSHLLDWCVLHPTARLTWRWRNVLTGRIGALVRWLATAPDVPQAALDTAAQYADPRSREVERVGADRWLAIATTPRRSLRGDVGLFLFSCALAVGSRANRLAEASFQAAHDALSKQEVSLGAWDQASSLFPALGMFSNWDRCERCRRALADAVTSDEWPAETVFRAATNVETFRLVIAYLSSFRDGRRVVRRLKSAARDRAPGMLSEQRDLLLWLERDEW